MRLAGAAVLSLSLLLWSGAAKAEEKGLVIVGAEALTVRRQRCGKGFAFVTPSGTFLRNAMEVHRLKALAVPPPLTTAIMPLRTMSRWAGSMPSSGSNCGFPPSETMRGITLRPEMIREIITACCRGFTRTSPWPIDMLIVSYISHLR